MALSGSDVRLVTAIEHAQFFEISEDRKRSATSPTIADCLKIEIGIIDARVWLLRFYEKPHIAEVGRQEGIVGAFAHLADRDSTLDFNFLFVRIGLGFVAHVPTKRDPKFIDE